MKHFEKLCIIGVGLLGGSLARVCKKKNLVASVSGFGRNLESLELAKQLGVIDMYSDDLAEAVKDADLIVFCSPVGTIVSRLREALPHLNPGCLITDVGSVKLSLVSEIDAMIPENLFFVGSHPIAGGEKSGVSASTDDLFCGAKCIVTPSGKTSDLALSKLRNFWAEVGMEVIEMSAEEHDLILGAVSHLPHVIAFTLINTLTDVQSKNCDNVSNFSGKGLKDSSRIAASDPVMWRDICLQNKETLLNLIGEFQRKLDLIRQYIENNQSEQLESSFRKAQKRRLEMTCDEK
ncbi:MAG: prephenate dehydrogenase [Nitrospinae bacterium CG11_big_fil_rev_8_21_14_0_20_45_15]|nr:MAG: prephenate dehydrogenase [Nitrospinae bacterium CG11_big_fil_rev_8_21_14_0_20_45_15]